MDEDALDRAIDAAVGALMARQPSRALGYKVMERVRERAVPAPRRFVWVAAAAGVALSSGIATMFVMRAPSEVVQLPREIHPPVAQAAVVLAVPADVSWQTPETNPVTVRSARTVALRMALPPSDVSPIAPIETQPIVLAAVEVPQLEAEATLVDPITIEPLIMEPLAVSND